MESILAIDARDDAALKKLSNALTELEDLVEILGFDTWNNPISKLCPGGGLPADVLAGLKKKEQPVKLCPGGGIPA
jgi:hypothetical protein